MNAIERHDETTLWAYAAGELDDGEARLVDEHLDECPECRERLASVHIAREALDSAREAAPRISWQPLDDAIGRMVEKRLASQQRRPLFARLTFATALVAAAVLAFVFWPKSDAPAMTATSEPRDPPPPPAPVAARVDRSTGLERSGSRDVPDGTILLAGDELKTTQGGRAFVHLPDLSHVRLGASSQLTLSRLSVDDVALTLERGRVAVRASHQDRKGFVVYSGAVAVHVVGTVFAVTNGTDGTEVAVSEGRVRVDLANDQEEFVDAGQRLKVDAHGRVSKGLRVTSALARELDEVMTVGDAATAVETHAIVAAAGGRTSEPPLVAAQGTPRTLPRLSEREARARQVSLPPEALAGVSPTPTPTHAEAVAAPQAYAPAPVPAPAAQRLEPHTEVVVEGPPRAEQPGDPTEWAAMPVQPTLAPAPVPADTATTASAARFNPVGTAAKSLARDVESIFMSRAEASIEQGTCDRFLIGLEEIAQDVTHTPRTELARVLRARCFNTQLRPRQAISEYRKYLEEYPRGRYLDEASEALGQ